MIGCLWNQIGPVPPARADKRELGLSYSAGRRGENVTDLVDRLAEHRTLGAAPREELAWLASHGVVRHLNEGDVLTAKGTPVEGLFVLLTGHVAIFVDRGAGRHKVMERQAGDVTGLLPYSRLVSPPGDSVALEPTVILALHRDQLIAMTRDCHQITSILVVYREHPAPGVSEHTGAGVYYGAAATEAPVFAGRHVVILGGGNSAGQCAMHLSRYAKEVQIVLRGNSLHPTMSRYLIEQIEKTANIRLRLRTEVECVEGSRHVERVVLKSLDDGMRRVEDVDAVFVFIGSKPRSEWLPANVLRDPKGFVLTGRDLLADALYPRLWKQRREPLPLETSAPGLFAAGDIRAGAMNRVASAVGEGSMVVRFVHEYLALT